MTVIWDVFAGALVHYYPFVEQIRKLEGCKLAVDCTGESAIRRG
jgi:hypothetical protein